MPTVDEQAGTGHRVDQCAPVGDARHAVRHVDHGDPQCGVEAFARGSFNIGLDLYVDGKKIASS